jgi:ectoine hydroxylase-related dioxygenase (phytanoyl-CoA dioxygenase family)
MTQPKYIEEYSSKGFAIIKNLFTVEEINEISHAVDIIKTSGLQHKSSFRHQNLLYLIQQDPMLGRILRYCHWPSYSNSVLEKYRTDLRILDVVSPLIGNDLKQVLNQVIWKTPGTTQTSYGYHQDSRFRRPASAYRNMASSLVQTTLAIDKHTIKNGCLRFIEGSHLLGDLNYYNAGKSVFEENISDETLDLLGMAHLPVRNILLEPGADIDQTKLNNFYL